MKPREWGQGAPALLLHCSNAHGGAWRGIAERLSDRLSMIAPDGLGHGAAPDWDGQGDFHAAATEYAAQYLKPDMHLIGHSFGATVALRLALCSGLPVASLTLIEPVFFAVGRGTPEYTQSVKEADSSKALIADGNVDAAAEEFMRIWGTGEAWADMPERQQSYIQARMHLVIASYTQQYQDIAGLLTPGQLEALKTKTLLLRGEASPPVTAVINAELARRMGAQSRVIPGAGHMLPVTHPAECAEQIVQFLGASQGPG